MMVKKSNNHIKIAHFRSLGRRYRVAPYVKRCTAKDAK